MAKRERITARRSPQDLPLNLSRVALYARVSTSNGHQDPEMQLAELREYAGRRGWEIVGEYTDQGVSGSKESRPELNRLMIDAHLRRFDAVLVWKIDRFGRSLKHLVNALADLGAYGVAFISLRDNIDLSTPSGRLMFQIIGAMAEFERALIQERVKAGLRNAHRRASALADRGELWILPRSQLCALLGQLGDRYRGNWELGSPPCTGYTRNALDEAIEARTAYNRSASCWSQRQVCLVNSAAIASIQANQS
jgi:DNA invertase Pin-like site-specific DNA recombinase